jgi:hypothetical protein
MSKHQEIRQHLQRGESITGLQAIDLYHVYRLSSVINRLRNEGLEAMEKRSLQSIGYLFQQERNDRI